MVNTSKYSGIDGIIIATAARFARSIDEELRLHQQDDEDIFHELIIAGLALQKNYRPGEVSEETYIFRGMRNIRIDIIRKYTRDCRKAYLYREQSEQPVKDDGDVSVPQAEPADDPDVVSQVHMEDLIKQLSPLQQKIVRMSIEEKSLSQIAKALGCSIAAVRWEKAKIKEKIEKLWPDRHKNGAHDEELA